MRCFWVLLSLFLAGCIGRGPRYPDGTICVTPELMRAHPAAEPALRAAAERYCRRGRSGECLRVEAPCGYLASSYDVLADVLQYDSSHPDTVATYTPARRVMFWHEFTADGLEIEFVPEGAPCQVTADLYQTRALVVATHELGHVFGYPHDPDHQSSALFPVVSCNARERNELP